MNLWDLMKANKMSGEVWWKLFWEEDSLGSEKLPKASCPSFLLEDVVYEYKAWNLFSHFLPAEE